MNTKTTVYTFDQREVTVHIECGTKVGTLGALFILDALNIYAERGYKEFRTKLVELLNDGLVTSEHRFL